ncbi:MAG: FKBP-type peptidyl-prolyl cis-trans isomerase [Saprospiraceae bacterium]|nr:FKBP-type peptidyl-prolyl cis-trans isomerase [Saprospiraceae bacterium]
MKNFLFTLTLAFMLLMGITGCKQNNSVQKTLNGFDFEFIQNESGDSPKEGDYVYFRYYVKNGDSTLFSSTMQNDLIRFKLPKIEKQEPKNAQPMLEAIYLMSKGDSGVVHQIVDEEMKKVIGIQDIEKLSFYIALVDVKDEAAYKTDMEAEQAKAEERRVSMQGEAAAVAEKVKTILADFKAGKFDASLLKTESGLRYIVHEAGNGAKAQAGSPVSVHYYGTLMDGTRFDDSWSRGDAFKFMLGQGQVIPGWDEGVANLNEGAKATLIVPAALGYGAEGAPPTIPGNSELMFYIEVQKVN